MDKTITIDDFNQLTGQETLHPLAAYTDLSKNRLLVDVKARCNFYALLCQHGESIGTFTLRLLRPGDVISVPSYLNVARCGYEGVAFHPDLLCGTPLERDIMLYDFRHDGATKLSCFGWLMVSECLQEINKELHHAIDRQSGVIIASLIELLLNYGVKYRLQRSEKA